MAVSDSVTPNQVHSVYKCIGSFVNFMLKKTHYEAIVAEISGFGTVIRTGSGLEFVPSHSF